MKDYSRLDYTRFIDEYNAISRVLEVAGLGSVDEQTVRKAWVDHDVPYAEHLIAQLKATKLPAKLKATNPLDAACDRLKERLRVRYGDQEAAAMVDRYADQAAPMGAAGSTGGRISDNEKMAAKDAPFTFAEMAARASMPALYEEKK